jgi:hypothetical protein
MKDFRILAVLLLFIAMVGLAYHIEVKARPVKDVTVRTQQGESPEH